MSAIYTGTVLNFDADTRYVTAFIPEKYGDQQVECPPLASFGSVDQGETALFYIGSSGREAPKWFLPRGDDNYLRSDPITWVAGGYIDGDETYGDITVGASPLGGSISFKTGGITRMAVENSRVITSLPLEVGADPVAPLQVVTKQYGDANYASIDEVTYIAASYVNGQALPVTFASGFGNYGGGQVPVETLRLGNLVTMCCIIRRTAGTAFASGVMCTIADTHRPTQGIVLVDGLTSSGTVARIDISTTGTVNLSNSPAVSVSATSGWVNVNASWRV